MTSKHEPLDNIIFSSKISVLFGYSDFDRKKVNPFKKRHQKAKSISIPTPFKDIDLDKEKEAVVEAPARFFLIPKFLTTNSVRQSQEPPNLQLAPESIVN